MPTHAIKSPRKDPEGDGRRSDWSGTGRYMARAQPGARFQTRAGHQATAAKVVLRGL